MPGLLPIALDSIVVPKIHHTWAKTFYCKPKYYFQPSKIEEIQQLVQYARENRRTIMTVGSGHSPSDITMTNSQNFLLNLDKFNRIIDERPDPSGNNKYTDLTVEAGIRVYRLNEYLATKGLAIQNLGSISEQSMAGIISTGTHGSSPFHGLVSQQIVDLTIVNSKGQLIKCSESENQDIFKAAMLSLGKIGIIAYVTIRTVPRYQIKSRQEVITFDTLLEKFDSIWTSDEFIRIWWFPYTRRCIMWRASKTEEPISKPRPSWYGTKMGRLFYESLLWISVHILPRLTPIVEKFIFGRQYGLTETYGKGDIAVQESVDGLNMDCLFSQFVNEWAAPLTNGPEILRSLDKSIQEAKERGDFYVHAPIEVRCSNTTTPSEENSDYVQDLSERTTTSPGPVFGNTLRPFMDNTPKLKWCPQDKVTNSQLTLYINATMYRPFFTNVPINKWFKIFEDIIGNAGGKPHWAKNFIGETSNNNSTTSSSSVTAASTASSSSNKTTTTTSTSAKDSEMIGFESKMEEWFGDDLEKFREVRREVDPEGVFLSGFEWVKRNGILSKEEIEKYESLD